MCSQILVFQCDSEFRPVSLTPMYAIINLYIVFWSVLCVYWWWGRDLEEGTIFLQFLGGPQSWGLGFFKQKEQFDANFCWNMYRLWSCSFDRPHGSEIAIQEHPTLTVNHTSCIIYHSLVPRPSTPPVLMVCSILQAIRCRRPGNEVTMINHTTIQWVHI